MLPEGHAVGYRAISDEAVQFFAGPKRGHLWNRVPRVAGEISEAKVNESARVARLP